MKYLVLLSFLLPIFAPQAQAKTQIEAPQCLQVVVGAQEAASTDTAFALLGEIGNITTSLQVTGIVDRGQRYLALEGQVESRNFPKGFDQLLSDLRARYPFAHIEACPNYEHSVIVSN